MIDGKWRVLNKRKYCLDCSPFNGRNTKPLHKRITKEWLESDIRTCTCEYCHKVVEYSRKDRKGHTSNMCGSCRSNNGRFARKKKAIEYLGGACQVCGYARCDRAMHFHHVNPENKSFGIGGTHTTAWKKVKVELEKCVLLCGNCHSEVHDGMTPCPPRRFP